MNKSSEVDIYSLTANMYGCEPCPHCKSKYRYVPNNNNAYIKCDQCGLSEGITKHYEDM